MTQKPIITILITNYNTSHFVEGLLYALHRLTKNPYQVLINDNGSSPAQLRALLRAARRYPHVFIHLRSSTEKFGSLAHGRALDALMPHVHTPYTAVFDSDAVVLQRNWDERLLGFLKGNVKIAGTPLGKEWAHQKPSDFPSQFIVMFETAAFLKLNISWQPELDEQGHAKQENGLIKDLAWQLKVKYTQAGLGGQIVEARNTRFYQQGPFKSLTGVVEYYLPNDPDKIFGSHFGRGHTSGQAKFKTSLYQLPVIGRTLSRWQGQQEVKEWLAICRRLIDAA